MKNSLFNYSKVVYFGNPLEGLTGDIEGPKPLPKLNGIEQKQYKVLAENPKAAAPSISKTLVKYLAKRGNVNIYDPDAAGSSPQSRINLFLRIKYTNAIKHLQRKKPSSLVKLKKYINKYLKKNKKGMQALYKKTKAAEAAKTALTEKARKAKEAKEKAAKAAKLKKIWGKLYKGMNKSVGSVAVSHMELTGSNDIVEQAKTLKRNKAKITKLQNEINKIAKPSGIFVRLRPLLNGKVEHRVTQDDHEKIIKNADTKPKRQAIYTKVKKIRVS